ncbi:MAG: glycoside hydrolase family 99-like domain-containing protein [Flavobacterium sp.]|nr:glycoside hydrolase family 99-like domain-containing protein [Flavobacterium sp.]
MGVKIKPIAIYLPQFHPIPENDEWWGKGFTEWTNVAKAQPKFEGHYQPHLPADLGFYDLRLEEARLAQEQMAKAYGIHGFCYYHYWFNGKRMLYEPLDRKLKNAKEDLPFMMCWANENWSRTWDGANNQVLLKQEYNFEDDLAHIEHLIPFFKDERYIKVNGKPVFVLYKPDLFPDIKKTISIWREEVKKAGFIDLYIGFANRFEIEYKIEENGFDFAFEFQPKFWNTPKVETSSRSLIKKVIRRIKKKLEIKVASLVYYYDYSSFVKKQMNLKFSSKIFPGITPMWDNSARRKEGAFILHNSSPEIYENWLNDIKQNYPWNSAPENFLFINAWNEWAEGNHLESCQKWGTAYLEATKEVLT